MANTVLGCIQRADIANALNGIEHELSYFGEMGEIKKVLRDISKEIDYIN
jgi:hypothetical protein